MKPETLLKSDQFTSFKYRPCISMEQNVHATEPKFKIILNLT